MAVVTLISDWGDAGYYTAAVHGKLLNLLPDVVFVNITDKVPRHDLNYTAYVLSNARPNFPEGTIHIIAIDSEENDIHSHVAVSYKNHFFIGADNGIFSLMFDETPDEVVSLSDILYDNLDATTFPERDRFAKVAAMIAEGKKLSEIGPPFELKTELVPFKPTSGKTDIEGMVVFIDGYENLVTNIHRSLFQQVIRNNSFEIHLKGYHINKISDTYSDVPESSLVAFFGSNGYLQIALNRSKAHSLLNIGINDKVVIEIKKPGEDAPPSLF